VFHGDLTFWGLNSEGIAGACDVKYRLRGRQVFPALFG